MAASSTGNSTLLLCDGVAALNLVLLEEARAVLHVDSSFAHLAAFAESHSQSFRHACDEQQLERVELLADAWWRVLGSALQLRGRGLAGVAESLSATLHGLRGNMESLRAQEASLHQLVASVDATITDRLDQLLTQSRPLFADAPFAFAFHVELMESGREGRRLAFALEGSGLSSLLFDLESLCSTPSFRDVFRALSVSASPNKALNCA